ncbi:ribosome production factor 1-like protein [Cricetulus griseus]|nr:ribosome production factor 1-like protein [Cricetulus griseus]
MQDIKASQENLISKIEDMEHLREEVENSRNTLLTRVEKTNTQIESKICSMSDDLNVKIARNRDRFSDLAQAISTMSEESTTEDDRLDSRIGYLEDSLHAIQILSKDENMKELEAQVDVKIQKLTDSVKLLESNVSHEIQSLHETMVARLQALDDTESNCSQSDVPTPFKRQENFPKFLSGGPV